MELIECVCCGIEFDPNSNLHKPYGHINECRDCGIKTDRKKPTRHVGIQGGEGINKSANIAIIKNPCKDVAKWVRNMGKSGFNANLPLGSTTKEPLINEEE